MILATDVIRHKRDGFELSTEEIRAFAQAAASQSWEDYQLSALLMAIFIRGFSKRETTTLTAAMTEFGERYCWDEIDGPKIDKHSTGGVGDKTSLILAPLAAACGVIVPMMSGRGLGHTGGTLDKLESIPGFRVDLSRDELKRCLQTIGFGMIGQTQMIAPADRTLYRLRDVTSTVESIPLITASILSKKLAEGIDGLIMDVKCGCGAFMKNPADAFALAESIISVGNANGLKTEALVTRMDAPLGKTIGNSVEVKECLATLQGGGPKDLEELSVLLAARMVLLGGLASDEPEAAQKVRRALESGQGWERFLKCVELQGGDPKSIENVDRLPRAQHIKILRAKKSGYISELHAEKLGRAAMLLGAGRQKASAAINPAVGLVLHVHIGNEVQPHDEILEIHYDDDNLLTNALPLIHDAITIREEPVEIPPLVLSKT